MSGGKRRVPRWLETIGIILLAIAVMIVAAVATAALIDFVS